MAFLNTPVLSKSDAAWKCARLLCFLATMVLAPASPVLAQSVGSDTEAKQSGELLLRRHCARCHAVGVNGKSPHPTAPMFKNISKNHPVEFLAESLAEGIVTGHPDMPVFYFKADEVEKIIAYLESIQSP